jgi:adenosylhomocysteinase
MPTLGNRWASRRPFGDRVIGLSAHLTTLTAVMVRELALGGGRWVICAASPATTDSRVVNLLRDDGHTVFTTGEREDAVGATLEHEPELIADVGGDLISRLILGRPDQAARLRGAVEITRSGITRLQALPYVPCPIVNINDGRLKPAVENRHGVGEGLWHAVQALTGMHLSGRRIAVFGYGPVGQGVAAYARAAGSQVEVVDVDPIRRLCAHYDGFPTPGRGQILKRAGIIVTATGVPGALTLDDLRRCNDGAVLINAGHSNDEIDVAALKAEAAAGDQISEHVTTWKLEGGPRLVLLAEGYPLNIVCNSGSPEPVLLHFALLGLTLEWLCQATLPSGLHLVPVEIEREAAEAALSALDSAHG